MNLPFAEGLGDLNSCDSSHSMTGHLGDNVDFCVELIRRVDLPRMTPLFGIVHKRLKNRQCRGQPA